MKDKNELKEQLEDILGKIDKENDIDILEDNLKKAEEVEKSLKIINKRELLLEKANKIKDNSYSVNVIKERPNSDQDYSNDIKNSLNANKKVSFSSNILNKSVTTTTAGIVLPSHLSNQINSHLETQTTLFDRVHILNVQGGDSYEQPYALTDKSAAEYTNEGSAYSEADSNFSSVKMHKTKITTSFEVSEEMEKLPSADYLSFMQQNLITRIKEKISKEIMLGNGNGSIYGITHNPSQNSVIDSALDFEVKTFNEDIISDVVFKYGSQNTLDYSLTDLLLNKSDLSSFYKLKDTNGRRLLDVQPVNQTIDVTRYLINNYLKGFTSAAKGDYFMIYGNLKNYQITIFSDLEIQRSTEARFKEGMIVYKAAIWVGGAPVVKNGFLRVKKG